MDLFRTICIFIVTIIGIIMIIISFTNHKHLLKAYSNTIIIEKNKYLKFNKIYYRLTGCVFVIFGTTRFFMYNDTYAILIVFALAFIIKSIFTHITKQYVRNKH